MNNYGPRAFIQGLDQSDIERFCDQFLDKVGLSDDRPIEQYPVLNELFDLSVRFFDAKAGHSDIQEVEAEIRKILQSM